MLFVKRYKEVDEKAYKKATGKNYHGSFNDAMPYFQLVDDETFEDVIINKKVYNPEKDDMDKISYPYTRTKHEIESLKKMGQPVTVVSEKELKALKEEANKLANLEAENAKLKKELEAENAKLKKELEAENAKLKKELEASKKELEASKKVK